MSHISDDDFARTVIAERFAHAPRLDPSGTSWLPFPFWITGGAMMAFGRSLAVARAVALALGGVGAVLAYAALRVARVDRLTALGGIALAMATPWNAWLGAATVPEGFTGAFVAAAAIAASAWPRARASIGVVLLCASLARYEVWPACLVVTVASLARTRPLVSRASLVALVPVAGPLAWMAWNLHAHGSATHFLDRVTAYRHAVGAAGAPLAEKLLVYPHALLGAPEILLVAAVGLMAFVFTPEMRRRWWLPLTVALAVLIFLVYGETKEGAPTHHPERALVVIWWILAPFGLDGARELVARLTLRPAYGAVNAICVAVAALGWNVTQPGAWDLFRDSQMGEASRAVQVARGQELRAAGAPHLVVTPCAYEHFALIAAYGAPESVDIRPPEHQPILRACPKVER
ncbi:hypothetical protein LVJ94_13090 [Pendulispora rubella]|uniref:Glycosyltransferase RgtA/B/C/D-like domain-containing protein n=1 Tax=Pendulispora rubella TaxID=2741070 RepID=A0ABZ2LBK3_9BACT